MTVKEGWLQGVKSTLFMTFWSFSQRTLHESEKNAITSALCFPGLGLRHFIWEKNGVEALGAFSVNSYIELSRYTLILNSLLSNL